MPRTIVCCSEIDDPEWRWVEKYFVDGTKFYFVSCAKAGRFKRLNLSRISAAWRATRLARKIDASALVPHGPTIAMWCGLFARVLGFHGPLLAFAFNFTHLPHRLKRLMFMAGLQRITTLVVASRMERELYSRAFRLNPDKMDFQLWAINPPNMSKPAIESSRYVSALGGNARDYKTLVEAAKILPQVTFRLVVRPQNLSDLSLPPNVKALTNIPFEDAMNILGNSIVTVVPLLNSETPCGHVTIICAMHLGVPVVSTRSSGVADYIEHGATGVLVEAGEPVKLAKSIQALFENENLRISIGKAGQQFAANHCTENLCAQLFSQWLFEHA